MSYLSIPVLNDDTIKFTIRKLKTKPFYIVHR